MTDFPGHLILPFLAAFIFAISSLCFKRAFVEGVSPSRSLVQTNIALGLLFLPAWFLERHQFDVRLLGWPILAGVCFFAGQCCNFAALRLGDVSLVTPIMGSKVVLVALCSRWIFGFPLTRAHWIAAALTALGVFVLGATDLHGKRRIGASSLIAVGSCLCFALVDTVIQRAAHQLGPFYFLTTLFGTLAGLSFLLWPWLARDQRRTPKTGRSWLTWAIGLTAVQALLITLCIGIWQDATGANVIYSLRGVWGVVLVGVAGNWFGNRERHDSGTRTLWFRLFGAGLILLAVALTLMPTGKSLKI